MREPPHPFAFSDRSGCQQIDISVTRWYHCMSRCIRQAFLLTEGSFNRKEWLEDRVEEPVRG